ncbi:hypothetical protein FOL47_004638 [Perkinsus chesapeaki]|uniref:Uncharacterized protein n=1 Tax=Perkinsus chesapeaki TaxID=330153 RepID=A0A7J6M2R5_PERCH|nr:hypothetical protein FOL47_004638 [Perkinsus chesapeaki]
MGEPSTSANETAQAGAPPSGCETPNSPKHKLINRAQPTHPYKKPEGNCRETVDDEMKDCACPSGSVPVWTLTKRYGYYYVDKLICSPKYTAERGCPPAKGGFWLEPFPDKYGRCLLSCSKFLAWCPSSSRCTDVGDAKVCLYSK